MITLVEDIYYKVLDSMVQPLRDTKVYDFRARMIPQRETTHFSIKLAEGTFVKLECFRESAVAEELHSSVSFMMPESEITVGIALGKGYNKIVMTANSKEYVVEVTSVVIATLLSSAAEQLSKLPISDLLYTVFNSKSTALVNPLIDFHNYLNKSSDVAYLQIKSAVDAITSDASNNSIIKYCNALMQCSSTIEVLETELISRYSNAEIKAGRLITVYSHNPLDYKARLLSSVLYNLSIPLEEANSTEVRVSESHRFTSSKIIKHEDAGSIEKLITIPIPITSELESEVEVETTINLGL